MSNGPLIQSYTKKEALLKQLQEELNVMEGSEELHKDFEFKHQLDLLLEQHGRTPLEAAEILAPDLFLSARSDDTSSTPNNITRPRKKRKQKTFVNPNTGEKVITRGGNQKRLNEWKKEYGKDTVDSWEVATNI